MYAFAASVPERDRQTYYSFGFVPDAPHAARLDIFARLAARACRAPIGLITLFEPDRTRCVSAFGLAASAAPGLIHLVADAMSQPADVTVSEDVAGDGRFRPGATDPQGRPIRLVAVRRLRDQDDHSIGALCVMDTKSRALAAADLTLLDQVGAATVLGIEAYREAHPLDHWADGEAADAAPLGPPTSAWELMADWLAEAHPECPRHVTDPWVSHYMRTYPKLVERLMIQAGLCVDLDCAIP